MHFSLHSEGDVVKLPTFRGLLGVLMHESLRGRRRWIPWRSALMESDCVTAAYMS